MACMAAEKGTSTTRIIEPLPLPPNQAKRCSLPGPSGSLNLYAATHQSSQRRLSERGLVIYRPSKPDIDLIKDFTTTHNVKRSSFSSSSGNPYPETGDLSQILSTTSGPLLKSQEFDENKCEIHKSRNKSEETPSTSTNSGGGRQVRLRIERNPGSNCDKYYELETITSSTSGSGSPLGDGFLPAACHDTSRRHSDSAAILRKGAPPPLISITAGDSNSGIVISTGDLVSLKCLNSSAQEIRFTSCSSKTSSSDGAASSNASEVSEMPPADVLGNRSRSFDATLTRQHLSGVGGCSKGFGSSWFCRRHQPISFKLPLVPPGSPSTLLDSPTGDKTIDKLTKSCPCQIIPGNSNPPPPTIHICDEDIDEEGEDENSNSNSITPNNNSPVNPPLLTITSENNETEVELIEVPSPPVASPESKTSPEEKHTPSKVAWDKSGYMLDAAALGTAIEKHLKSGDLSKRRATISALYEPPPDSIQSQITQRTRSASAYNVVPLLPNSSISGPNFPSTSTCISSSQKPINKHQKFFLESETAPIPHAIPNPNYRRKSSCGLASGLISSSGGGARGWDTIYPASTPLGELGKRRASCIESIQFAIPSTADEKDEENLENSDEEEEVKVPLIQKSSDSKSEPQTESQNPKNSRNYATAMISSAAAAVSRRIQTRRESAASSGNSRKNSGIIMETNNEVQDPENPPNLRKNGGGGGGGGNRRLGQGQGPFMGFTICNVIRDFFVNSFK